MKETQMPQLLAKGSEASRLRQRKYELVREFGLPENLLAGRVETRSRRCGRSGCRCSSGAGHAQHVWRGRVGGEAFVEHLPDEWEKDFELASRESEAYFSALEELCALNRALIALTKQGHRAEKRERSVGRPKQSRQRSSS